MDYPNLSSQDTVGKAEAEKPTTVNGHDAEPKAKRKRKSKPGGQQSVWSDRLIIGREGPRDCIANVALVLREDPSFIGLFTFNVMSARVSVGSLPWHPTESPRQWIDRDAFALAEWVQLHGLVAKPSTCEQAVQTVAQESKVHPLQERLSALKWDGIERLDSWLTDYLGVEKTGYTVAVGRKWLVSGVARAFVPGCKADHALILEGGQGKLKSTLAEIIALDREWFTDEIADLGSKDSAQDLPGKWIVEISELAAMGKSAVERTKAFLSRAVDHYRPSYGRHSQDFPRGCIFIGSTNATEYLTDATGNRRFWPVKVGLIDLAALRLDAGQLWAEAVAAYHAGEKWWLAPPEEVEAAGEQEQRVGADPWAELVLAAATAINSGEPIECKDAKGYITLEARTSTKATVNAILHEIGMPAERREVRHSTRVGIVLNKAGWSRKEDRNAKPPEPRYWYEPAEG